MTRVEAEVVSAARELVKARDDRERDDWDWPEMGSSPPVRHHLAAGARREPPCPWCVGYLDAERRLAEAVAALPFHWMPPARSP